MDIIDTLVDIDRRDNHMLDCGHFAGFFRSESSVPPAGTHDWGYEFNWAFMECSECGQDELRAF